MGVVGLALSACGAESASFAEPQQLPAVESSPVEAPPDTLAEPELDITAAVPRRADHRPTPAVAAESAVIAPHPRRQDLDQPAIWPAPDVVFATPEEAAADFVSSVLISEGDPALGAFQQGDAGSGEIAVLFAGETGDLDPPIEMGLLFMRQIGPTDGWYVIAAASDGATIDSPAALEQVEAGTVTVSGEGRGFESTLVVSAFPPGDDAATFDLQIGAGGAFADLEPYSVELDLSGAAAGDVVVILVHGDTGLGNDPSTFAAIPVVIESAPASTIPPTR
jgi:hypothetical protein